MIWTESATARLRELRSEGYSASYIARELGCTRNAVMGKAHRLGLPRQIAGAPAHQRPRLKARAPHLTLVKKVPKGEPQGPGVRFPRDDFSRCAYIIADGVACGMKRVEGSPFHFCPSHASLCLVPPDPKKAAKPFVVRAA